MTMLDTLFGLIPAASRGQQWVADELQLVNWGGYDGAHRVRFSPTATLLCGGSGSGKSTLMDAYVALMMPHTTPFNGASNGAVVGRPRGQEQRNILSYARGKTDETRTDDGTKVTVLRGDGVDTWSAVSMTWLDHDGSRFTAVRAWYIPAGARLVEDTVRVRATVAGPFDLSSLEDAARQRLTDAAVKSAGLDTVATDREFSARLHAVLGIGAAGAGAKAMSLLARIQAGQQITTVDDLYKRMVLEEPETMATADAVVAHFDGLESTRSRMLTAQQQVRALQPIRSARARIEEAAERLRVIDEIGRFSEPDSLATLWRASRRLDLLRDVEAELQSATRAADAKVREQQALADAADIEREGLGEVLRAAGGDRLETAHRELRGLERRLIDVARERERLDAALGVLEVQVASAREFEALADRARRALADPDAKATLREAYGEAISARNARAARITELEAERREAAGRHDNIPARLRESRELLARAAGLSSDRLPFVGELIEVRTEFEPWREAFNLALGGFATTLLIDTAHLPAFRAAIESVRTSERLRYEGVHTGLPEGAAGDPQTLPGRLDYRSSPFTGWLQDELSRRFGYVCVDTSADLSAHRMALTIAGQTSQGARGAHGGHGRRNVLGFSTDRRVGELDAQLGAARAELEIAQAATLEAAAELDALDARRAAFEKIQDLTWEQVDVASVEAERERWTAIIDEVTAENPTIAGIQSQIAAKRSEAAELREGIGRAKAEQQRLADAWAAITDEVDTAQAAVDAAEDAGRALTDDQAAYLDGQFLLPEGAGSATRMQDLARFDAALDSASRRFAEDQRAAQEAVGDQRESLRRTLAGFLDRWPNPNLLADPDHSLADFERILTELETSGLHELETEWRDSLLKLSGNDLTNLDSTLSRSLREIRDRIEPINLIMQDLPFYDDDHRLQITPRETQSEARRRFRKELREVRALIDAAATDEDRERVYVRMSRLIDRLRRTAPDFAELVDVRNHVRVSAERVHAVTKQHVALYDHIGEKSGGESQELIAFIVGAALRYQLGDAGSQRPRYAPVFLDEALIKADAHFTKRAIGAWRGLGFQLIIGAPNDKYSAIEPHVDVEYDILKDTHGRSWAKPKVGLAADAR
ncbi:AAA family ATPase [Microbacterium sp. zg.Y625]|uniref:ATP-binding protein n=1 Tax=Microbacterium jiangjiandongii TaxID=3049071 RepID=UPI00214B675E|nr:MULTISPECIES: SbcC/MukB-like Walker B domain-containing protein [unclassified Microbacterium]MCR2794083.1 AAA family ATPase [Microbacterium sp. zg.Y625]WIM25712.1 ATP-binding protein [Microbacterium sp. zg-Y625]